MVTAALRLGGNGHSRRVRHGASEEEGIAGPQLRIAPRGVQHERRRVGRIRSI